MFRVTTRLRFIEPQLASAIEQPPEGKHWIHEIKHDGYRSQVVIERSHVRVFSRNETGALMALLAYSDGLNYAGAAFITLGGDERKEFLAEVERLTTSWGAFKSSQGTDVKWCRPRLVVRVKHLAGSKTLRHATVRALEGADGTIRAS